MTEGPQPRFTTFEAELRRERLAEEAEAAELDAQLAESATEAKRLELRLMQLLQFVVDRGGSSAILVVFNMQTGQAAAAKATGTSQHGFRRQDADFYRWDRLQRIRVSEASRLLQLGTCHLTPVTQWEYERGAGGQPYPEWLFDPTDEQPREWKKAARSIHLRAVRSMARSTLASLIELIRRVLAYSLAVIIVVVACVFVYILLTGGSGFLGSGG